MRTMFDHCTNITLAHAVRERVTNAVDADPNLNAFKTPKVDHRSGSFVRVIVGGPVSCRKRQTRPYRP